jgi:YD repeat-containing protein
LFGYNGINKWTSLIDPKSNVATWDYDVQGRLTLKTYPDRSTVTYTYETTTSRLKSIFDALGQAKQYTYAQDNRLTGITYLNAANATPNVTYAHNSYFPRVVSMTDGTGASQYGYVAIGSLGARRLLSSPHLRFDGSVPHVACRRARHCQLGIRASASQSACIALRLTHR